LLASIVYGYCYIEGVARTFSLNTALAIDDWKNALLEEDLDPVHSFLSALERYTVSESEFAFLQSYSMRWRQLPVHSGLCRRQSFT
jgi:hypothetical protein